MDARALGGRSSTRAPNYPAAIDGAGAMANKGHEVRDALFCEIVRQDGTIEAAGYTGSGHQWVECTLGGETMRLIYSASPSDWRAALNMRSLVRRKAAAARKRADQQMRLKPANDNQRERAA